MRSCSRIWARAVSEVRRSCSVSRSSLSRNALNFLWPSVARCAPAASPKPTKLSSQGWMPLERLSSLGPEEEEEEAAEEVVVVMRGEEVVVVRRACAF